LRVPTSPYLCAQVDAINAGFAIVIFLWLGFREPHRLAFHAPVAYVAVLALLGTVLALLWLARDWCGRASSRRPCRPPCAAARRVRLRRAARAGAGSPCLLFLWEAVRCPAGRGCWMRLVAGALGWASEAVQRPVQAGSEPRDGRKGAVPAVLRIQRPGGLPAPAGQPAGRRRAQPGAGAALQQCAAAADVQHSHHGGARASLPQDRACMPRQQLPCLAMQELPSGKCTPLAVQASVAVHLWCRQSGSALCTVRGRRTS